MVAKFLIKKLCLKLKVSFKSNQTTLTISNVFSLNTRVSNIILVHTLIILEILLTLKNNLKQKDTTIIVCFSYICFKFFLS